MITAYSKKIVNWLLDRSGTLHDEEDIEVYVYGLECFFNTAIPLLILTVWGVLTHTTSETLCWIMFFSILRHHAGGLHASTQFTCILSSVVLGMSNYIILQYQNIEASDMLIISICCIIVCIFYAPVDSGKLQISLSEARKQKIISIVIIMLGTLVSVSFQNSISISIMYSFFCTCTLILIKKVSDRLS